MCGEQQRPGEELEVCGAAARERIVGTLACSGSIVVEVVVHSVTSSVCFVR